VDVSKIKSTKYCTVISKIVIKDTSIDDFTLLEICKKKDSPARHHLLVDKRRHVVVPKDLADCSDLGKNDESALFESMENIPKPRKKKNINKVFGEAIFQELLQYDGTINSADSSRSFIISLQNDANECKEMVLTTLPQDCPTQKEECPSTLKDAALVKRIGSRKVNKVLGEFVARAPTQTQSKTMKQVEDDEDGEESDTSVHSTGEQKKTQKTRKLHSFFGHVPADVSRNIPSQSENQPNTVKTKKKNAAIKINRFFGEVVPANASGKTAAFFGTHLQNAPVKLQYRRTRNYSQETDILDDDDSIFELEAEVERPAPKLIAQHLEEFFPGIEKLSAAQADTNNFKGTVIDAVSMKQKVLERAKMELEQKLKQLMLQSHGAEFPDTPEIADLRSDISKLDVPEPRQFALSPSHKFATIDNNQEESHDDSEDEPEYFETHGLVAANNPNSMILWQCDFVTGLNTQAQIKWIRGPMIGEGSYGKVYYGANANGDIMAVKQVGIKKFNGNYQSKALEAIHQEVCLLQDLDHANIVKYIGYEISDRILNVFLEYVSGGSVASALASMGPFPEPFLNSVTRQILTGLEYLHSKSILHRDVKGANILIDDNGWVKISDFGVSKRKKYGVSYDAGSTKSIQGSVFWMAPEVVKSNHYSAKIDIWSLGCVVLEMLTGEHPWAAYDEVQTMWRLGKDSCPPCPDDVTPETKDFISKCLTMYTNITQQSPSSPDGLKFAITSICYI
jgi:hypothetical protein